MESHNTEMSSLHVQPLQSDESPHSRLVRLEFAQRWTKPAESLITILASPRGCIDECMDLLVSSAKAADRPVIDDMDPDPSNHPWPSCKREIPSLRELVNFNSQVYNQKPHLQRTCTAMVHLESSGRG